jgi:hypothetical protein
LEHIGWERPGARPAHGGVGVVPLVVADRAPDAVVVELNAALRQGADQAVSLLQHRAGCPRGQGVQGAEVSKVPRCHGAKVPVCPRCQCVQGPTVPKVARCAPRRRRCCRRRCASRPPPGTSRTTAPVMGRGHVSLLASLDIWYSKLVRDIGYIRIFSPTKRHLLAAVAKRRDGVARVVPARALPRAPRSARSNDRQTVARVGYCAIGRTGLNR